jgi:hypothetical protein
MIEGLERSSLFKNAKLVSADENKSYNHPGVGFEIICDMEHESSPPSVSSVGTTVVPTRTDFSKEGQERSGGKRK